MVCDPVRPEEKNENKLVHLKGVAQNKAELSDLDFGVVAQDSYRLRRKVEMYQWCETYHPAEGNNRAFYTYAKVWSETPLDSTLYRNHGFDNPNIFNWPYRSVTHEGFPNVKIGKFVLSQDQLTKLGKSTKTKIYWSAEEIAIFHHASRSLIATKLYGPLKPKGAFLVSSMNSEVNKDLPHIGQIRVSFDYDKCSNATVISKQVSTSKADFTFAKWFPETRSQAPEKTGGDDFEDDSVCTGWFCCYPYKLVDKYFTAENFEESVDYVKDGLRTPDQFFSNQEGTLTFKTWSFRFLGLLLGCIGLYLNIVPLALAMKPSVPLLCTFLDLVEPVTAPIYFSLIVGLTFQFALVALAWLFTRPLMSVALLIATIASTYMIFTTKCTPVSA